MATDSINSISGYITSVRGTTTNFVRASVINTEDLVDFESAKTAGASLAGTQTVHMFPIAVAGNDAGLVTGTYTASINLDGVDYPVSVAVTTADTFATVITAINADLPATELSIVAGNLVVTSATTGNASYVVITDVDLFSGMTGFLTVKAPVDGGVDGALKLETLDNGANAFKVYSPAIETFNTTANYTVLQSAFVPTDLNAVFADTEVEADFAAVAAKLNALQALVIELLNKG